MKKNAEERNRLPALPTNWLTQAFPIQSGLDDPEAGEDWRHPIQEKRKAKARLAPGYWSVGKEYVVSV